MTITADQSYASLSAANAYALARDWADWDAATDEAKEAALLEATAYLDATYRWPGTLADLNQPLGWPRSGAYDREGRPLTGVPAPVASATIEAARLALSAPLLGGNAASEPVLIRKRVEGVIEREWAPTSQATIQSNRMALVAALLSGIVRGGSNTARVVRA